MESKKPKKQRKAFHEMPLHRKQKAVSAHLNKRLREELGVRAMPVRKGDTVKVMRGSFKGKNGKVSSVNISKMHVFVEKITRKKADGTEAIMPLRASNLLIESLEKIDEKRFKRIKKQKPAGRKTAGEAGKESPKETVAAVEEARKKKTVRIDSGAKTEQEPEAEKGKEGE